MQTAEDVRGALAAARAAQPGWAALSFAARARFLERALAVLLERQDEFIDVILRESGKPRTEALMIDIFASCDSLAWYAKNAERILRPRKQRLHGMLRIMKKLRVVYQPLGVVGVISPVERAVRAVAQPERAGADGRQLRAAQALGGDARLGAPGGRSLRRGGAARRACSRVLTGDGETGAALVEAGVDKISFTGSVATGRKVALACARQLIPCTLELGGKDPMIVCADADLDVAAGGAVAGAFFNTGQYCCGTERVYVVEAVADAFTRKVVERTAQLRQGDHGEFDVGAVFWGRQLEIIEEHVNDAVAKGAKVLVGGRRNPNLRGLFYEPTVLTDVTHEMRVMREETFGPVLPIVRVASEDEAIRLANDSDYGLSANVWTGNPRHGVELAQRIRSGSVCVNDMAMTYGALEAPFGGRKASGVGQVNGESGLRGYCFAQPILVDRFGGRQTAKNYPYSFAKDAGMQRLMRLLWGTPLGRWLS